MAFTAKDVMALREKTGAGVMDCKKALIDADGDMNKAAELLRERGIAKADKKASRKSDKRKRNGRCLRLRREYNGLSRTQNFGRKRRENYGEILRRSLARRKSRPCAYSQSEVHRCCKRKRNDCSARIHLVRLQIFRGYRQRRA